MTLKPCMDCGVPTHSTRCTAHRGYDSEWERLSKRARRMQPFCSDCGATENLTADHLPIAWERRAAGKRIRLQDIEVVCGRCNTARGQRRPDPPPAGARVGGGTRRNASSDGPVAQPNEQRVIQHPPVRR